MKVRSIGIAGATIALVALTGPGQANEVADFYKGKTVSIVVGHQAGTGFDIYARALAPHLARHIPGNPSIIVQNMVGASGIVSETACASSDRPARIAGLALG